MTALKPEGLRGQDTGHWKYLPQPILGQIWHWESSLYLKKSGREAAPLTLSLPQEANNVGWRPSSLPFIPRSCQHHGTLRKAAPSHEQHTWGASGGQAGDSEQFLPEQGKEKSLVWLWLLGNIELLTFNILWQGRHNDKTCILQHPLEMKECLCFIGTQP